MFEPDSIVVCDYNSTFDRYHDDDPYSYYNLSTLRNLGQNYYGCDFAALSGRYGEFTCETGGEEVARKFIEGFSERALHPIYFTVTDFKESEKPLHIKGALN